jgi:hypothetical protein
MCDREKDGNKKITICDQFEFDEVEKWRPKISKPQDAEDVREREEDESVSGKEQRAKGILFLLEERVSSEVWGSTQKQKADRNSSLIRNFQNGGD